VPNRSMLRTLIGQEERAVKIFIWLFPTVIFVIDIGMVFFASELHRGWQQLFPYLLIFILMPISYLLIKEKKSHYIKYIMFGGYTVSNLICEIVIFWDKIEYSGGNVAEVYFLIFTPIFINKRFFWTVLIGTEIKYGIIGVLFLHPQVLVPMGLLIVLAVVAYILLNRFLSLVHALNESYLDRFEKVVKGIISTLELKDPYTKGHSLRVAEYASLLAKEIGIYKNEELRLIYSGCLLHDVGKVHIPDYILEKPEKLSEEEFKIVKQHPIVGAEALRDIDSMEFCMDIVLYHHERWDGKGYPEGLRETRIPLIARIAAIADSFDAMTSHRSYRNAMTVEQAYEQILSGEGSQYDPVLIPYFKTVYPQWVKLHKNEHHAPTDIGQPAVT
jgi:putative nucleotidyltransferase with HDIG domain